MPTPVEIGPFIEGVNLVDPTTRLSMKEVSECRNFRTGPRGNIYKRPGHDSYGSSPAKINGDVFVNLMCRYYKADSSKLLIAAAGGKLRKGNDSTGAWTDISIDGSGASMNASNLCDWMVYKDRLYITDGTKPQRYNGTDDIYAGHYIHAAPTLAQTTGGSLTLTKTYKYFVTSVAGDMGEGPAGAVATILLTGANNRVDLSSVLAAPAKHGETTKRIYRTKGDGALYYLLAEIPTGTTTYQDTIADSSLNSEYVAVSAPPATARFVIMGHDDRAYWFGMTAAGDQSLVRVSDVGFPDRVPDLSFLSVANNDGDILTGGGLVPSGLVFFKRNSMWLSRAYGFGLINIRPREKRGSGVGTTSPFSIVTTPIGLIFLSQRGEVYLFDGTNIEEIGRKIASEFRNMTSDSMGKVFACYHDYRYIISYDYRSSKGYNWRTLEYDIITGKWEGPHENGTLYTPSYYAVYDSVLDKGELAWGEANATTGSYAYIRGEFSKTDRGNKFLSKIKTGALVLSSLGDVITIKGLIHGTYSVDATMKFTHIDELGTRDEVDLTVPLSVTTGRYNFSKYNQSKYGGIQAQTLEGPLSAKSRSKTPMYEISDGGTATEVSISNIHVLVNPLAPK